MVTGQGVLLAALLMQPYPGALALDIDIFHIHSRGRSKTKSASGVLKELNVAIEKVKNKFQIIGYKNGTSDWAVPGGGRTYSWNWENLKKLLS